jgi:hypothetical protein
MIVMNKKAEDAASHDGGTVGEDIPEDDAEQGDTGSLGDAPAVDVPAAPAAN